MRFDQRVRRPLVNEPQEAEAEPQTRPPITGSGFRQECRPEHSSVTGVKTILSIRNRRFCGVVLLRAADRVQQDSRASVPA
jgi:hypothetical protein